MMALSPLWTFIDLSRVTFVADPKKRKLNKDTPDDDDVRVESLFDKNG